MSFLVLPDNFFCRTFLASRALPYSDLDTTNHSGTKKTKLAAGKNQRNLKNIKSAQDKLANGHDPSDEL